MTTKTTKIGLFSALLALLIPFIGSQFAIAEITLEEMKTFDGIAYDSTVTDELEKVTSKTGVWLESEIIGTGETVNAIYNVQSLDKDSFDVTITLFIMDSSDGLEDSSTAHFIVDILDEETFNVIIPAHDVEQKFGKGGVSAQTTYTVTPSDTGYMSGSSNVALYDIKYGNNCWGEDYFVDGDIYTDYTSALIGTGDPWYWASCITWIGFSDADIYLNAQSLLNQGRDIYPAWTPTLPLIPDHYTLEADFNYS